MRGLYLDQISRHLGVLSTRVKLNSKAGRVNIDVDSELTVCRLINCLEDWNLICLNEKKSNFPGIDLADRKKGIAVQITATATGYKINHTMTEFVKEDFQEHFSRLIVVIINDKPCPTATECSAGEFRFRPAEDIWNLETIYKSIQMQPIEKLKEISEFLNAALGYIPVGPRFPLPGVPQASRDFLKGSRDRELDELDTMFETGRPIFLWGVGGIGKTEVAIQLAARKAKEQKTYFLNYCSLPADSNADAMRETILQANFANYRFMGEDNASRDAEYRDRMDMLRTEYAGSMLIIDNFDRERKTLANLQSDPAYRELTSMDIHLVFTTRNTVKEGCEIKPLDEGLLLSLMKKQLGSVDVEEDQLRSLIQAVDRHTLMVLLMAKTLEESWGDVTPDMILTAMRNSALKQTDFPEVVSDQNQLYAQKQIYSHLKALFDLSGMHNLDYAVLRCATLLPEGGMERKLFLNALPKDHHQSLRNLVSRGWLRLDHNLLTIHPLIRDVCWEELKPSDWDCKEFLDALYRQCTPEKYNVAQILQLAGCLSVAADQLPDSWGDWAYDAARLWSEIGHARTALRYAMAAVKCRDSLGRKISANKKASAYNMVANTYNHLGEYTLARKYGERALNLRKKCLPAGDPKIAASYNNLGTTYSHLGEYGTALKYLWNAVYLREAQKPRREDEIASTYNNIGTVHQVKGEYEKALIFREKALKMRQTIYVDDPHNPDLVTSINNVGRTLHELGRYEKALTLEREALAVRKETLHEADSDLANSYYNVGHTLGAMEKYQEAVEHLEMALHTWELGKAEDNIYYASTQEELSRYRAKLVPQSV